MQGLQIQLFNNKGEKKMKLFKRNEKGQTLIEYGLIIALVAIVVVVVRRLLGPAISNLFQNIISNL